TPAVAPDPAPDALNAPDASRGSDAEATTAETTGRDRLSDARAPKRPLAAPKSRAADLERKVAGALAFVRRRITGEAEVDDFGFDPELTDQVLLALMRPLYEKYFRVEVRGLENVPAEGGALVVANHSGTIPLDSVMTQIALRDRHPA